MKTGYIAFYGSGWCGDRGKGIKTLWRGVWARDWGMWKGAKP
jgi:hypothetical protein